MSEEDPTPENVHPRAESGSAAPAAPDEGALEGRDYERMIQALPLGVIIHQDGLIHFANPAAARMVGREDPEELVGRNVLALVPDHEREKARRRIHRVQEEREATEAVRYEVEEPDGSGRTLEVRGLPVTYRGEPAVEILARDRTAQEEARRRLEASEERYRAAFERNVAGVFRSTLDGELLECNAAFAEMFGYDDVEEVKQQAAEAFHPEGDRTRGAVARRLREEGEVRNVEVRRLRKDGSEIWVLASARLVEDPVREERVVLGTTVDITDRKEAERRYRELFEHNVAGVFRSSLDGELLECNPAFADILGYDSPEEIEGEEVSSLYASPEERGSYMERLRDEGALVNEELLLERRDGTPVWVLENSFLTEDPNTGEVVNEGTLVDITDRKKAEARLEEMAYRDLLTGLGNRRMLQDQAERVFSLADRRGRHAGLAYLDLNRFKQVNDRWGHQAGDEVLRRVADRLRRQSRESDLVARVGGDEFVVLFADLDSGEEAITATRRMTAAFDAPFEVGKSGISLDVSAGVATYPADGDDLEELLNLADRAMYRAGAEGTEIARYRSQLDFSLPEGRVFDEKMRKAVDEGQLVLHYQPFFRLPDRTRVGAEALVRWRHPKRGLVPAGEFVPQAERTGVVRVIDEHVVQQAVHQLARWQKAGDGPQTVAVNLGAASFRDPSVLRRTSEAIREAELPDPGGLLLEITESEAMRDPAVTAELLHGFRETGLRVALDDFGTGHSSLAYLDRYPVSRVKLDRQFTAKVGPERGEERLVRAMIELAHRLGLEAVAEGVEEEGQMEWLVEAGCDMVQGHLLGYPVPADEL